MKSRLRISQQGNDGFGYKLDLYNEKNVNVGSIVFRQKTYLKKYGYPNVNELHIGFEESYQRRGYFQDALLSLLQYDNTPIYISKGRVINYDVFKAIKKLDKDIFTINELESGYIIDLI
jgi:hypothetical protein